MNKIEIANGMIFQALDIRNKDTFEARLVCQKKIYLLQESGIDLGYGYNWYIKGPYSPNLSTYIYNNLDDFMKTDFSNYHISSNVTEKINRINSIEESKPKDLNKSAWYELVASVLYIYKNHVSWRISSSFDEVFSKLEQYKPQFNWEQFIEAVKVLKEKEFITEG